MQRVTGAAVEVDGEILGKIEKGLVVFVGVAAGDQENDCRYIAEKIAGLRIFEDEQGKMNLSLQEIGGAVLCVSQFTLYGDCRKGRRPNFIQAAVPEKAITYYESVCELLAEKGLPVARGKFQAKMSVKIENDGPVTILLDSRKLF